jgi:hypothetical protein
MVAPKKRSLEEFFSQGMANGAERKDYVTVDSPEVTVDKSPTATRVFDKKSNKALVDNSVIDVDAVPVSAPAPAPIAAPVVEAPKPEGPYTPLQPQTQAELPKAAPVANVPMADTGSDWERAMIGATPLLVGLLTGNTLEGTKTSANYFVGEEGDRYKRAKDFNGKIAEMQAKRSMAGTDAKTKFDKTEVFNPETGKKEIWSMANGRRYEYLGQAAPDAGKDKFGQVVVESEKFPGRYETWSTLNGEKYKNLGNDFKKEDVVFKESFNPETGKNEYKMFSKSGDSLGFVGQMPEGAKKYGMSLEDRMAFAKYKKDLDANEVKFKQTRDLNKDREGVITTKNTRALAEAHGKIFSTAFGKDPIQDVGTVISLFKMLDPGSVVRESELALGISAKSHEDWLDNAPALLMKQGYLTPTQRTNIRNLADKMYKQQLQIQESSVDSQLKKRASKYGLDGEDIAPAIRSPYKAPSTRPLKVMQDGHEYTWNPKTGDYE